MTRRLIDRDPITGEAVWYEYSAINDTATITHEQDVAPILEGNVIKAADDDRTARGIKRDFWHYARVPNIVWLKWKQEKGIDIFNPGQKKELFKLLNDPEYKFLKTTAKTHSER